MATLRVPQLPPSSVDDAQDLRKAFEGWGTDEKAVIEVLAHRDAIQRQQIVFAYEQLYDENFTERLQKELTSDLERAVLYWMLDPTERYAVMAYDATKESVDYRTIVEIASVGSPSELLAVRKAYHTRYSRSLEEDVASNTTGDLRKILVAVVSTYRFEGDAINEKSAQSEAKTLHDAILAMTSTNAEEKTGSTEKPDTKITDEAVEELIRILSTRSKAQLNATFNRYKDEYGTSITKDLSSNAFSSDFGTALRAAVWCIIDPKKYYEKVLRRAIAEAGTDEDALTRVIVTRAEKDLKEIMDMYQERTSVALDKAVGQETSGDYKDFLLALLGQ